jgi:hypothetical protein
MAKSCIKPICQYGNCDAPSGASGLCRRHYKAEWAKSRTATKRICIVEGCGKPVGKRDWCNAHYLRWQRHGDPLGGKLIIRNRKCSIEGCNKPHWGHGYCQSHLFRFKRNGNPLAGRVCKGEPLNFLENVVLLYDKDDCLLWPYGKSSSGGYGVVKIDGRQIRVNRRVCELVYGSPPTEEYQAAHKCGNSSCCNPKHLYWATPKENQADRISHGTASRGEQHALAKLTEKDVHEIRFLRGKRTRAQLSFMYGISVTQIRDIQCRKSWKHV